jgi:hypothetical protein
MTEGSGGAATGTEEFERSQRPDVPRDVQATLVHAERTRLREVQILSVRLKKESPPPYLPFGGCLSNLPTNARVPSGLKV